MSLPNLANTSQPKHRILGIFSHIRTQMQPSLVTVVRRLQDLAPWQQNVCWLGSIILAIALIWSGLWQPLQRAHLRADQSLQATQKKLLRMQTQAASIGDWAANNPGNDSTKDALGEQEQPQPVRDVSRIVQQTASLYGIDIRISDTPMTETNRGFQTSRLVVHLKNTTWSAYLQWIATLHRQQIGLVSCKLQSKTHGLEIEATLSDRSSSE